MAIVASPVAAEHDNSQQRDARQMLLDEEVGKPRGWVATESDERGDMDGRALSVLEVNVGPLMQAW
jgi:hypothetical protein